MDIHTFKQRLRLPIIAAPMFLVSGVDLVVACCEQGIVGTFPALNGRTSEDFERMLIEINERLTLYEKNTGTKAAPYGVNLIVHKTNPRLLDDLKLCVKYKVPLIITSLGAVADIVEAVHGYGGIIFHDVIKKRHAEKAAEAGVDGIICVSTGAGGHAGTTHPFSLIESVRSVFDGAIILAGCINKGNEVAAAEVLGADFAYMGTRFIATEESMASLAYKQMICNANEDDIVYTPAISGVAANFLIPSIQAAGISLDQSVHEDFSQLHSEAKAWKDVWSAGQGVNGITSIPSTKDLVQSIKEEYQAATLRFV